MTVPFTLVDIRNKIRRITARPSAAQISDAQIDAYINTAYVQDFPEHLRLQSLRVNYQFITNANQPVYDFPKELYLDNMPPVFIGGYQSYMVQSRENFYRINPRLMYMQSNAAIGTGLVGPYTINLTQTPVMRGYKRNPPGAYSVSVAGSATDVATADINWSVLVSGTNAAGGSVSLVDDGQGNLFDPAATSTVAATAGGTINYITGAIAITAFPQPIALGATINVQYTPYVASRPQSVVFYQDQFILYPIPDQAYQVSFECYKYPTAMDATFNEPQLREWWQLIAYMAADKIFADNGDFDNMQKFRPLLDEQMRLVQRRTIVQQTSDRTATIYTEQTSFPSYPFGNLFSGF